MESEKKRPRLRDNKIAGDIILALRLMNIMGLTIEDFGYNSVGQFIKGFTSSKTLEYRFMK
jgi:hypothetical protein